jgi:hypothetical protein
MGAALELGKLSAAARLGHHDGVSWRLRSALSVLVAVLLGLNDIGACGFLARAHIGHAVNGDVAGLTHLLPPFSGFLRLPRSALLIVGYCPR